MHTQTLTLASPFPSRFLAWLKERFPFANALLFFILYLATATVVRAGQTGSLEVSLRDLIGCLVTWSFFLLLRVLDEHKDYQLDCHNHPQRVLQSGLISLRHLKVAGVLAVLAQGLWSLWLDQGIGQVTLAWVALLAWTGLMAKEFFIHDWLNRHLTWYAVSHMLVMPLVVWWLANLAAPGCTLSLELQAMMALAFVSGFCFEITRKTKGPEEERDSIESYSRIFGTRSSAVLVVVLVSLMLLNQLWLLRLLVNGWPVWAVLVLVAAYALALRQLFAFIRTPSAALRGKNEALVALTMLAGYAVLIATVALDHGLSLYLI
ncbi:MAG: UbiA family prenyltransferase [Pseudomonas sp.]|uniref:UbiA family prenyltransferase n=1 Tax=Pseudomonas sp. TaxID=306 RepID=UPI003396F9DD